MAENDASGNHTEPIDFKYQVLQVFLKNGRVAIEYCFTTDRIADVLTMHLTRIWCQELQTESGFQIDDHFRSKATDGYIC